MIKSTKIVRQDTLFSDLHADVYRSETKQKGIFMNDEDIIDLFLIEKNPPSQKQITNTEPIYLHLQCEF